MPELRPSQAATVPNAPCAAEGNGQFSNLQLAGAILFVPWLIKYFLPFRAGFYTYLFLLVLTGVPTTVAYWYVLSKIGSPPTTSWTVNVPGKPASEYYTVNDAALREKWNGKKMPMQIWHDAYFDGKIDIKGDMLKLLEFRWDWASFEFTYQLFHYVFVNFIPDVIKHSQDQDQEQIRDNYDRGNDFYEWFLGPRMIYTSGVITDPDAKESLEQLQDNKLRLVCEKLNLGPEDHLLDIGCGWGTLAAFAAKNYGCEVTGVTLAQKQAEFGNERIKKNGCDPSRARILCLDYRHIPKDRKFTKIVTLEMAEHVGVRRYSAFLADIYGMLEDDGLLLFQVAGLRPHWQFHDLVWGLFMNKYIFPGADASCALNWVVGKLENAGFEVKSIDVLGVHYAATLWRWYENWIKNKDAVVGKYGEKLYRIWLFFLGWSVIVAREGGSSLFQLTLHKNLNGFHRVNQVKTHFGTGQPLPQRSITAIE